MSTLFRIRRQGEAFAVLPPVPSLDVATVVTREALERLAAMVGLPPKYLGETPEERDARLADDQVRLFIMQFGYSREDLDKLGRQGRRDLAKRLATGEDP